MPQHLFRDLPPAARASGRIFNRSSINGHPQWLDTSGSSGSGYLPLSGGTVTGGLSFGSVVASPSNDLSRHIALYSTTYGFNVTSHALNIIVSSAQLILTDAGSLNFNGSTSANFVKELASNNANGPMHIWRKARGSIGSEAVVSTNDVVGTTTYQAYTGSTWMNAAQVIATVQDPAPSPSSMSTRLAFWTTAGAGLSIRMALGDTVTLANWALPLNAGYNYNYAMLGFHVTDSVSAPLLVSSLLTGIYGAALHLRCFNNGALNIIGYHSRGSAVTPTASLTNDYMLRLYGYGQAGQPTPANVLSTGIAFQIIEPTPGPTAMGGQIILQCAALGASSLTNVMTVKTTGVALLAGCGISIGNSYAASATDLSKHLALYSTTFGISITASPNAMNYVCPSGYTHSFYAGSGSVDYLDIGGSTNAVSINRAPVYISNTADTQIIINKFGSGNIASLIGKSNNLNRWQLTLGDTTNEGGSNAGSNFALQAYADGGGLLGNVMTAVRSTQVVTFAQTIVNGSDARWKENVEEIPQLQALDIVGKLRGVYYDVKGSPDVAREIGVRRQIGLIAQEVKAALPEAVTIIPGETVIHGISYDNANAIAYGNLVAVLVQALKELNIRLEKLEGTEKQ